MKKRSLFNSSLIMTVLLLGAEMAAASVNCGIYVPSNPSEPQNIDKELASVPVPPSPSDDPQDERRFRYAILKQDNSAVTKEFSRMELDEMEQNGDFKSYDGDTLISLQESAQEKSVYVIYSSSIDASKKFEQWKKDAMARGAAGVTTPLQLYLPNKSFAVSCRNQEN